MRATNCFTLLAVAGALLLAACSDDESTKPEVGPTIDAIENLSAARVDPTMVDLRWSSPTMNGASPRSSPAFYELLYREAGVQVLDMSEVQIHACDMTTHPSGCPERYVFEGLTPNTAYFVWMRSVDEDGNRSGESNRVELTTPEQLEPGVPKGTPAITR